ncbi:MAG: ribonuclease P protein component [Burkholderiales bacterium]|nr:ribonuclease P protein component [Burkholderiales bacterium]
MAVAASSGPGEPREERGSVCELADNGFPKSCRILKADEFSSVFGYGRSVRGKYFHLSWKPGKGDSGRLGVVTPKRVQKLAVGRNRAKRMVREYFRLNRRLVTGLDVIVRLRRAITCAEMELARRDLGEIFVRVANEAGADLVD